jgi:hypothetical protein
MKEEHLTVDQCDELAKALHEDAARLRHGPERESLLRLAEAASNAPMMSVVGPTQTSIRTS